MHRAALALAALVPLAAVTSRAPAQIGGDGSDGPFAPAANATLDTTRNGGVFQFTVISIPAGVTVRVTGPNPAVLRSQGPVDVSGELVADGLQPAPGAGGFAGGVPGWTGTGGQGAGPGGGAGGIWGLGVAGEPAAHATAGTGRAPVYGAAFPFDPRGGSGGGGSAVVTASQFPTPGGGGGGSLAVLADAPIVVHGRITARGGEATWSPFASAIPGGPGSGGSILLRSLVGVAVAGAVDVRGGGVVPATGAAGGDGFVRIDGYSSLPLLARGSVTPAPLTLELPHLRQLEQPAVGGTWRLRVASVPGDVFGVFFALAGANVPTPFGTLRLDGRAGLVLGGRAPVPATGVDPLAALDFPVPNDPVLVGFRIHAQGFNGYGAVLSPRLTNGLVATVQ